MLPNFHSIITNKYEYYSSTWRPCEFNCGLRLCKFKLPLHAEACNSRSYDYICKICDEKYTESYNNINIKFQQHLFHDHAEDLIFLADSDDWSFEINFDDTCKIIVRFDVNYYKNEYFWAIQEKKDGYRKIVIEQFFTTDENCSLSVYEIRSDESKFVFQSEVIPRNVDPTKIPIVPIDVFRISPCGTIVIKFVGLKSFPKEILNLLECNICNIIMTGKIYLCTMGHSLCDMCSDRIKECALCKSPFSSDQRNYLAESIISTTYNICDNMRNGCQDQFLSADRVKHLNACKFKSVDCPKCNTDVNYFSLYGHLMTACKNVETRMEYELNAIMLLNANIDVACFKEFGETFYLDFLHKEENTFLAVRQMTRYTNTDRFYYEIKLFETKDCYRQANFIGKCELIDRVFPINISGYTYCKVNVFKLPKLLKEETQN